MLERPALAGVADAVGSARILYWRSAVTEADAAARAAAALDALRIVHPALEADIAALCRSFVVQFGVAAASLRVEVVNKQSCPGFHCDNVRVRLVTTYHGPTTEYVRVDAPEVIRAAPLFGLVFLKGQQHPNHADTVHHRSPAVPPGEKRLCVILDV